MNVRIGYVICSDFFHRGHSSGCPEIIRYLQISELSPRKIAPVNRSSAAVSELRAYGLPPNTDAPIVEFLALRLVWPAKKKIVLAM